MVQAASLPPLTEEAQVHSQDSLCGKHVEQNGTRRGFFNTLLFPSQNYSTTVTYIFTFLLFLYGQAGKAREPSNKSVKGKRKGKAVPLQACSGPEGSGKLRFPDRMTTAQDGGKVVSLNHRPPLPPGNAPGTHFC
jgi:hypothetical protein